MAQRYQNYSKETAIRFHLHKAARNVQSLLEKLFVNEIKDTLDQMEFGPSPPVENPPTANSKKSAKKQEKKSARTEDSDTGKKPAKSGRGAEGKSAGKRKRSNESEEEVGIADNSSRKKARRSKIATRIFGDTSSQSEDDERATVPSVEKQNNKEDKTDEKYETESVSIINSMDSSVEILSAPSKDRPATIDLFTQETMEVDVIEVNHEDKTSQSEKSKNGDPISISSSNESSLDDEVIQSSQQIGSDSAVEKRRSRRSLKKQKSPGKKTPSKKSSSAKESDSSESGESTANAVNVKRNKFGETFLHQMAKKGDLAKVKELLEQGADPNLADHAGWCPLHELAISKKPDAIEIMQLIIKSGGDVNCVLQGITPLQEAILGGCVEHARVLLEAGAKPDEAEGDVVLLDLVDAVLEAKNKEMLELMAEFFNHPKIQAAVGNKEESQDEPTVIQETQDNSDTDLAPKSAAVEDAEVLAPKSAVVEDTEVLAPKSTDDNISGEKSAKDDSEHKESDDNKVDKAAEVHDTADNTVETAKSNDKDDSIDHEVFADNNDDESKREKVKQGANKSLFDGLNSSQESEDSSHNISGIQRIDSTENNPFTAVAAKPKESIDDNEKETEKDDDETAGNNEKDGESKKDEARKIWPESNKENNKNRSNSQEDMTRPSPAGGGHTKILKEKKKIVIQSRVSQIINLTSKKSSDNSASSSTPTLSRSASSGGGKSSSNPALTRSASSNGASTGGVGSTPWSKYQPSPSDASPSAGILKRKISDDMSSAEKSPLTRHVHFNHDPVSERVEIPRMDRSATPRKKIKLLFSSDQDKLDSALGGRKYEETPPLDVSTKPIYPSMLSCIVPAKDLILQLAASISSTEALEKDLEDHGIVTVGHLAALNPAEIRNINGIRQPKDMTVKKVLSSLSKTSLAKKAPVMEITTKEEEESNLADLFHRPSPSPTSPIKGEDMLPPGVASSPISPIKSANTLLQKSARSSSDVTTKNPAKSSTSDDVTANTDDPWEAKISDTEESLSVRAKRLKTPNNTTSSKEKKQLYEDLKLSFLSEAAKTLPIGKNSSEETVSNEEEQLKKAVVEESKELPDSDVKTAAATSSEEAAEETAVMEVDSEIAAAAGNAPKDKTSEVGTEKEAPAKDSKDDTAKDEDIKKKDLNNLEDIIAEDNLSAYTKPEMMEILRKTAEKQQQLAAFMAKVSLELNKRERD
eukprot:TRINITY_DN7295_c0_g1_i1.p1 TRINITY_DN7295_c0_g1~~TRINITY_DN7295_c0_g1_i1.p1  ORF type:complete len:1266 (+),score=383.71 TRINITY_DN7295_c0_g1_i1:174-3800(+)